MPQADVDVVDRNRTPGFVLTGLGGLGVVVGAVLLAMQEPVGLLVLMVGLAACVLGLDMWVLRTPQQPDAEAAAESAEDQSSSSKSDAT